MKLDIDCVRGILLTLEEKLSVRMDISGGITFPEVDLWAVLAAERLSKYAKEDVTYALLKLSEGGLIDVEFEKYISTVGKKISKINSITYQGHQFLDCIRSDTVFNKVKKIIAEKGIESGFGVLIPEVIGVAAKLINGS